MIYKNGKDIEALYRGTSPILEVYRGKLLVWQAVHSCYGNGYWINDLPWSNDDAWKN